MTPRAPFDDADRGVTLPPGGRYPSSAVPRVAVAPLDPPLPSEVLESVDAGRGVKGWVLQPSDLDRLLTLYDAPPAGGKASDGYLADAETWTPDYPVRPEVLALMRLDRVLGNEGALSATGTGRVRGLVLSALRQLSEEDRQPAQPAGDGRYRPAGDSWPQEGITLTYGELRRLLALHLAQLAHTMGRTAPWRDAEAAAAAMADGETPLRLAEVLD